MIIKTVAPVKEILESITLDASEARAVFSLIGNTSVYGREQVGLTHANAELLSKMYERLSNHGHSDFLDTCDKKSRVK